MRSSNPQSDTALKNKFDFYDVVEIVPGNAREYQEIVGRRGAVLGMAQDENTCTWYYAVSLESNGEVSQIPENNLIATGDKKKRSDFYDGDSIKVRVDPETYKVID